MTAPIAYSRRGGAHVGAFGGTWPFGKIAISTGSVTVSVFAKSLTLTADQVKRVEPLGMTDGGFGVRLWFRGQQKFWDDYVEFHSSYRDEILAVLASAGFRVI